MGVLMNIAICEDNHKEQAFLSNAIKDWALGKNIHVKVLCYNSAEEFMFSWPDITVDVIFLDIKMKELNGLLLAKRIRDIDKNIQIVFATSFKQYVLNGYDVSALNYLIKPLKIDQLNIVLDKAHIIHNSRYNKREAIIIESGTELIKLHTDRISHIKTKAHTAQVHTDTGIIELSRCNAELISKLPQHFVRCHRSIIVNLTKIDCIFTRTLVISSGAELPVSRRNLKSVKEAFVAFYKF